ncbi:MAG TPA: hypothetical protein VF846_15095, partial [Thermoanaerobaculia bacterium]
MTEQTRRSVLRYGIAIDLVILAAGVTMLLPPTPAVLIAVFTVASSLGAVRGGWRGGAVAIFLSLFALGLMFPEVIRPSHLATYMGLAMIGAAAVVAATRPKFVMQPAALAAAAAPIAVPSDPEFDGADAEPETFAEKPLQRGSVSALHLHDATSESHPAPSRNKGAMRRRAKEEAKARRQAEEEQRVAAARAKREAEVARQRVEMEVARVERERLATERRDAERRAAEEARDRAEAERIRVSKELEERIAREREEARLEQERVEAERLAAEAALVAATEERERVARELEAQLARERAEAE